MFQTIQKFLRDDTGVTPVEYGLIAAIVTVAMTVAASAAGFSLADLLG
jgi:Flp pilus assembly pilin Flp